MAAMSDSTRDHDRHCDDAVQSDRCIHAIAGVVVNYLGRDIQSGSPLGTQTQLEGLFGRGQASGKLLMILIILIQLEDSLCMCKK